MHILGRTLLALVILGSILTPTLALAQPAPASTDVAPAIGPTLDDKPPSQCFWVDGPPRWYMCTYSDGWSLALLNADEPWAVLALLPPGASTWQFTDLGSQFFGEPAATSPVLSSGQATSAPELDLYDPTGKPTAYVSFADNSAIYLWTGQPAAFLDDKNVYGFNGKHLGWFEGGVLWDHQGRSVGITRQALPVAAYATPAKYAKYAQPARYAEQAAPAEPAHSLSSSTVPLSVFLQAGIV
jgi:hypothetical protein